MAALSGGITLFLCAHVVDNLKTVKTLLFFFAISHLTVSCIVFARVFFVCFSFWNDILHLCKDSRTVESCSSANVSASASAPVSASVKRRSSSVQETDSSTILKCSTLLARAHWAWAINHSSGNLWNSQWQRLLFWYCQSWVGSHNVQLKTHPSQMMSTCCRMYPVWWNIFLRSANSSYSSWLLPVTKSQNLGRKVVDVVVVQKSDKNSTLGLLGTSCSPSAPSTCSRGWSSPSWPRPRDQSGDNQGLEFGRAGRDLALMEAFVHSIGKSKECSSPKNLAKINPEHAN